MANPQKENGFTPIANEIMEALYKQNLPGQAFRLVLLVLRKTYGFHKKEDAISLSKMEQETGIHHVRCSQLIKDLVLAHILTVSANINGIGKKYIFNKDFDKWDTLSANFNRKRKMKSTLSAKRNRPLAQSASTKDTFTKDTFTKEIYSADSHEIKLSNLLFTKISDRDPLCKKPDLQSWAKNINSLIRIDGRSPQEIEKVICWCQEDEFWQNNILSTAKLRKQFSQLLLKAGGNNGPAKPVEGNRIPEYKGTEVPIASPAERERGKQALQQIRLSIEKNSA